MPLRHPGRWAAAAVLLVLAAMLAHNMLTNPRWQWGVIRSNLFSPPIVSGAENTIKITIFAMAIGVILGILLAVMRLSPNPILSGAAWLYIWFFRGTPVYVQLLFWYFISYLQPTVSLGIPFGPQFVHMSANTLVSPLVAAILGSGSTKALTTPRSYEPGSSRSTTGNSRRRSRSARSRITGPSNR